MEFRACNKWKKQFKTKTTRTLRVGANTIEMMSSYKWEVYNLNQNTLMETRSPQHVASTHPSQIWTKPLCWVNYPIFKKKHKFEVFGQLFLEVFGAPKICQLLWDSPTWSQGSQYQQLLPLLPAPRPGVSLEYRSRVLPQKTTCKICDSLVLLTSFLTWVSFRV